MVNFFIKCLFGCIDNLGEERKNNKLRFFFHNYVVFFKFSKWCGNTIHVESI